MPENWSREAVEATVAAYLDMLDQELRGVPFNKSDARRRLRAILDGRSEGAIERKHQNISAILIELGFPYVSGYKPLSNYQRLLYDVVRDRLLDSPRVVESTRARVEEPIVEPPDVEDVLQRLVERPKTREQRTDTMIADTPRPPRPLANYLEIEARNRRLGLALARSSRSGSKKNGYGVRVRGGSPTKSNMSPERAAMAKGTTSSHSRRAAENG